MESIKIFPGFLRGEISPPPSKSICHRAIIAAALASGQSTIENVILSEDISATAAGVQALGAKITYEESRLIITGGKLSAKDNLIVDCRESGSTLRFLIPIGLAADNTVTYMGKGNLSQRPLVPYIEIFNRQGINYTNEVLPMTISGKLKSGLFQLEGNISSQFITGLMFALPLLESDSIIELTTELESKGYVDLTIDVLASFGVQVSKDNENRYYIKGNQLYVPTSYTIEADYSQAAFWLAAGALSGDIVCNDLNRESKQGDSAIIELLNKTGAAISKEGDSIRTKFSSLQAFEADVSQYPDLAPILAVIAALSHGTSRISGAARLRLKECDRLLAITTELNKLGANIVQDSKGMTIVGVEYLKGGEVDSWGDHRIAMALAIAALKSKEPVMIRNSSAVNKSYPHFFTDFRMLGGNVHECNLGKQN